MFGVKMSLERPGVIGERPVRWLKNCSNDNKYRNNSVWASFVITGYYIVLTTTHIWNILCSLDLAMNKTTLAAVAGLSNVLKDLNNLGRRRS